MAQTERESLLLDVSMRLAATVSAAMPLIERAAERGDRDAETILIHARDAIERYQNVPASS